MTDRSVQDVPVGTGSCNVWHGFLFTGGLWRADSIVKSEDYGERNLGEVNFARIAEDGICRGKSLQTSRRCETLSADDISCGINAGNGGFHLFVYENCTVSPFGNAGDKRRLRFYAGCEKHCIAGNCFPAGNNAFHAVCAEDFFKRRVLADVNRREVAAGIG